MTNSFMESSAFSLAPHQYDVDKCLHKRRNKIDGVPRGNSEFSYQLIKDEKYRRLWQMDQKNNILSDLFFLIILPSGINAEEIIGSFLKVNSSCEERYIRIISTLC